MKKLIYASLIAITAVSGFAGGTEKASRSKAMSSDEFYMRAGAGVLLSDKKLSGGEYNNKLKSAASYNVGVGYKINDEIRTDLNLSYRKMNYKSNIGDELDSTAQKQSIKNCTIMLNGYYNFINATDFTPYVTAGIGISKNNPSAFKDYSTNPNNPSSNIYEGKKSVNFSWDVGFGSKYMLNDNLDLDLTYRYLDLGKIKLLNPNNHHGFENGSSKVRSHEITLGAIYNF